MRTIISSSPSTIVYSLHSHIPSPTVHRLRPFSPLPSRTKPDLKALNPPLSIRRSTSRCRSGTGGPPGSGDGDSKAVLDAFFLGKAFAEALNERIESSVGEFLSVIGQWQSERRKEVVDFQEEVAERAKRAKEKAAVEAMEAQGLIVKSSPPPSSNVSTQKVASRSNNEDLLQDMLKD